MLLLITSWKCWLLSSNAFHLSCFSVRGFLFHIRWMYSIMFVHTLYCSVRSVRCTCVGLFLSCWPYVPFCLTTEDNFVDHDFWSIKSYSPTLHWGASSSDINAAPHASTDPDDSSLPVFPYLLRYCFQCTSKFGHENWSFHGKCTRIKHSLHSTRLRGDKLKGFCVVLLNEQ